MAAIDDAINSLSSDELDLLNSDPQMLSDFKAKYSSPQTPNRSGQSSQSAQPPQSDPHFWEIEKQPGLPTTMGGRLKDAAQTFVEGALNPMPGSMLAFPLNAVTKTANEAGATVAQNLVPKSPILGRAAGFGTAAALNPLTYTGALLGPEEEAIGGIEKPGLLQRVFNLFKKPAETDDIESAVGDVQDMVKNATSKFGNALNAERSEVGLPTTPEEMENSLKKFGNIHNIDKDIWKDPEYGKYLTGLDNPNELAKNVAVFKDNAENMAPAIRAKLADYLQNVIASKVDFSKSGGGRLNGLLKTQYGDLGDIIDNSSKGLSTAKSNMSDILDNIRFVTSKMEDPGQAQAFLKRLYSNPTGKNADYLNALRNIESMTGKETLDDLFNKFSSQSSLDLRHPIADTVSSTLRNAGNTIRAIPGASIGPAVSIPGAMPGNKLFNISSMQSLRDKLRNQENRIEFKDSKYATNQ